MGKITGTVSLFHTSNLRGGPGLSPVFMLYTNRLQLLQLFKRRQKSLLSLLAFRESYGLFWPLISHNKGADDLLSNFMGVGEVWCIAWHNIYLLKPTIFCKSSCTVKNWYIQAYSQGAFVWGVFCLFLKFKSFYNLQVRSHLICSCIHRKYPRFTLEG